MIRFLVTFLIFMTSTAFAEQTKSTCGLFVRESFDPREEIYTITTFTAISGDQVRYRITNPELPAVQNMLRGFCYCANGAIMPDPSFSGDLSYLLLTVESVPYGPYKSCSPFAGR